MKADFWMPCGEGFQRKLPRSFLREEKSLLIVPGDHFGMDGYLRIGFGDHIDYLQQGLDRLHQAIADFG